MAVAYTETIGVGGEHTEDEGARNERLSRREELTTANIT